MKVVKSAISALFVFVMSFLFSVVFSFSLMLCVMQSAEAQDWHQGAGPTADYHVADGLAPVNWSVTQGKNIAWTKALPETGQSTVVIHGDRLFYSCYVPVKGDSQIASDIIAYCARADNGEVIWQRTIKAKYPLRLSGCFSDSTSPPAVTDGKRVCFFNASGTIACFDIDGKPLWRIESMAVGRSQPFLVGGNVAYIKQTYMPDEGKFSHGHKNAPVEQWTQLQALNMATGKVAWTSSCGVGMGSIPMLQKLSNGSEVILLGRGGGHGPPEKPLGVSMIDADNGKTLWTLPLAGFMSTQTYPVVNDQALIFHGASHLWVDCTTGKVVKEVDFCRNVSVREWDVKASQYVDVKETLKFSKTRAITQQSNMRVGDYHYFRAYKHNYLGRVHLTSGTVEYLALPLQLISQIGKAGIPVWGTKDPRYIKPDMKNNNGFVVMGDKRSMTNTWGHHASPLMSAVGEHLYVPTLFGTVYCLKWNSAKLDEKAIASINDLGPSGATWTRASFSFSNGKLYARTIRQLICIEAK